MSTLHGRSKVISRLSRARAYLKKIGAVDNSERGVWSITAKGREHLTWEQSAALLALREADKAVRAEVTSDPTDWGPCPAVNA